MKRQKKRPMIDARLLDSSIGEVKEVFEAHKIITIHGIGDTTEDAVRNVWQMERLIQFAPRMLALLRDVDAAGFQFDVSGVADDVKALLAEVDGK